MKLTDQELEELKHLVAKTADEKAETREFWNTIFWKLILIETEDTK